jgi:hypothetical protein
MEILILIPRNLTKIYLSWNWPLETKMPVLLRLVFCFFFCLLFHTYGQMGSIFNHKYFKRNSLKLFLRVHNLLLYGKFSKLI